VRTIVYCWERKGKAILISAYLNLTLDRQTRRDQRAFIEKAYQWVLKRPADETGLNSFVNLLEQGIPQWVVLEALFASDEYYWQKNKCSLGDILHSLRCKLVQQLPPAEVIVDLGGAAGPVIEGALLWMGYPHAPREITIIDLPPDRRMFATDFTYIDKETTEWLVFGPTRVRYLHQSMTDLFGIADESVDMVWLGESIEHITLIEAGQMFREIWRVLKPGGYFCLDTPNRNITKIQSPDQLIHPEHKLEYTIRQLTNYLSEAGFKIIQVMGLGPMPKAAQSGVFNWFELVRNAHFSDNAEICYLFYVQCTKPEASATN
jgi:predicted SAM-dependent methyltransferase